MKDRNHIPESSGARTMYLKNLKHMSAFRSSRGQVLVELAIVMPLLILIVLGVVEMSYLLYDQHVLIRLSREGSNLISRDVSLGDAGTAMTSMVNPPVDLSSSNSKMIFTVLTKYSSGANTNYVIVYQRYEIGSLTAASAFTTQGALSSSSFGSAPDYIAVNPANDTNLRVTNVPSSLTLNQGQFVYVTEIYSRHALITYLNNFGVSLPSTLYSIAYF
ncbi:MAG TPA: TadE family protein [Acidobacteriota bacterium]|nr:TadE family protein [Acidobacteriota bacterium]